LNLVPVGEGRVLGNFIEDCRVLSKNGSRVTQSILGAKGTVEKQWVTEEERVRRRLIIWGQHGVSGRTRGERKKGPLSAGEFRKKGFREGGAPA